MSINGYICFNSSTPNEFDLMNIFRPLIIILMSLTFLNVKGQLTDYPKYYADFDLVPGRITVKANNKKIVEYKDWIADYFNNIVTIISDSIIEINAVIRIYEKGNIGIYNIEDTLNCIRLDNFTDWSLSGIPLGQPELFPEAFLQNNIAIGCNRAKLVWHTIDPLFYDYTGNLRPPNITNEELFKPEVRQILVNELFPNRIITSGIPKHLTTFDMIYYPNKRGPYNFDTDSIEYSSGIDTDGFLKNPKLRWGGIIHKIDYTNWKGLGVKYIDMMLLDPYITTMPADSSDTGIQLVVQIGRFSEDINKDGYQVYEAGIHENYHGTSTAFGIIPNFPPFNPNSFDRNYQDVGLDAIPDSIERIKYAEVLNRVC